MRARVCSLRHVAPGQWNAVAPIHGAQAPQCSRVKKVPIRIRRHLCHSPHDYRWCQLDRSSRLNPISFSYQEAAERHFRTEQSAGEETAFEVSPREQNIPCLDAGVKGEAAVRAFTHLPPPVV